MSKRTEQEKRHLHEINRFTDEQVSSQIDSFGIGFSYAGGYINSNGSVFLKCNTCGAIIERSMVSLRHGKKPKCPNCIEIAKLEEARKKEDAQKARHAAAEINRKKKQAELEAKRKEKTCIICGATFVTTRSRKLCCSPDCARKHSNQLCSYKKRARIAQDKLVDTDISVQSLYKRDKGVCAICGGSCDYSDYTVLDNNFIAGDWYPSVDHIIPIAKGGEHSWENVQLAHRICNYRKRDSMPTPRHPSSIPTP